MAMKALFYSPPIPAEADLCPASDRPFRATATNFFIPLKPFLCQLDRELCDASERFCDLRCSFGELSAAYNRSLSKWNRGLTWTKAVIHHCFTDDLDRRVDLDDPGRSILLLGRPLIAPVLPELRRETSKATEALFDLPSFGVTRFDVSAYHADIESDVFPELKETDGLRDHSIPIQYLQLAHSIYEGRDFRNVSIFARQLHSVLGESPIVRHLAVRRTHYFGCWALSQLQAAYLDTCVKE